MNVSRTHTYEHDSYKKALFFLDFVNSKLNQFQINTSMRQSDMTNNKRITAKNIGFYANR